MFKNIFKSFCINLDRYTKHQIKSPTFTNVRLDRYVSHKFNLPWNVLQKHFRKSDIFIVRGDKSEIKLKDPSEKLQLNDKVYISRVISKTDKVESNENHLTDNEKEILLDIFKKMNVFNSKDFIIIDKICNIATQGGTNIKFSIDTMLKLKDKDLKLVHRLDRSVTGLMLAGSDIGFVRKIGDDLKNSKVEKVYLTLCQDIPMYLKYMIKYNKINPSSFGLLRSCLSGHIRSNENGDRYIIEMGNNYQFVHLDSINVTKQHNSKISSQLADFEMFGKFKITHFVFYERNSKKYLTYNLDMLDNLNEKEREKFIANINLVVNDFNNESGSRNYECFTICLYELVSGRKHQIRKHMSRCFMTPIFNDEEYLFEKEDSKTTYKSFYDTFSDIYTNEESILSKFKIGDFMHSVLLHSIQLRLPLQVDQFKAKKTVVVKNEENSIVIKSHELPENFQLLFKIFDKKLIDYFIDENKIIKL
jgi:23S rRNA-/tRNA-specific pseudouridylate synthase